MGIRDINFKTDEVTMAIQVSELYGENIVGERNFDFMTPEMLLDTINNSEARYFLSATGDNNLDRVKTKLENHIRNKS